jgi:hypothetical protein
MARAGEAESPLARARVEMLRRLRGGSTFRDACGAARVAWREWKRWRMLVEVEGGTTGDPDKDALVRDAREAHDAATADLLEGIVATAKDDWKAAAWVVEYRAEAARRASEQRRAHHEARLAKARADEAAKGVAPPTVVIELPASLVRPRSET